MKIERIDELVATLLASGQKVVSELKAKELLRDWGLPVPPCLVARDPNEAANFADTVGYPVALKVHSPAIIHKSDVGGVKLDLGDRMAVERAYGEIETVCAPLDPHFKVLVQPMAEPGLEVILGVSDDAQFGPVVMFGVGGILVELFQDVSFRLIPLGAPEALDMISSIRAFPLLEGYRGKPAVDIGFLADMVVSLSELVTRYVVISELDLNPVIVYPRGAAIVDARLVLKGKGNETG